jgi:LCP family protein required for cell wall assembly
VNPPLKRMTVISIPRDSRVAIPGHGTKKINSASQLGGASLTIETVKQLTGLPITHYMTLDFNGFKDLVDAIGGVTIDVPQRINDSLASDHNWRASVIEKGPQKLDGVHALTFVRSRQFADGDITRVKDQQMFLKALAKQTMQIGNVVNAPKIIDAVMRNVKTDMSAEQIMGLGADFRGMPAESVEGTTVPGLPKYIGGTSYYVLDEERLADLLRRVSAGESIAPTATAGAGVGAPIAPSSVTVTVRNGSGRTGLAATVAGFLKKPGFQVPEVGNASKLYGKTVVVYKTEKAKAKLVRDQLGAGTVVPSEGAYVFETDVLVIVGRDWREG